MKTKSALSYFGSDSEVAGELAAMLNHCKHVTIPFCGGMSILPHLTARAIVANDLNNQAINFYRVLSGVFGKEARDDLLHRCETTLNHPHEMALADLCTGDANTKGDQAWAYWAKCWLGRKGKGGTRHIGGAPSIRRTASGGTNASRIRSAAGDLEAWAKHFERCEWECIDFREQLPKVADTEDCGVYCDPPWVEAGDGYLHPFTVNDHLELFELLDAFTKTTVLVRYGDAPLIRNLYQGWRIIEASSRDQCNAVKGELWICNKHEVWDG